MLRCGGISARWFLWLTVAMLIACTGAEKKTAVPASMPPLDPYPSTYVPPSSGATLIKNVTILTGAGQQINNGAILLQKGVIQTIGASDEVTPSGIKGLSVIDGTGRWVTPGVIDAHSHLGVYPSPSVGSTADGNELTDPVTPHVWAEHSIWTQDPGFTRALAGGVTTMQVLPGSGNLFGGRTVFLSFKIAPNGKRCC